MATLNGPLYIIGFLSGTPDLRNAFANTKRTRILFLYRIMKRVGNQSLHPLVSETVTLNTSVPSTILIVLHHFNRGSARQSRHLPQTSYNSGVTIASNRDTRMAAHVTMFRSQMEFLGFNVSAEGWSPTESRVSESGEGG